MEGDLHESKKEPPTEMQSHMSNKYNETDRISKQVESMTIESNQQDHTKNPTSKLNEKSKIFKPRFTQNLNAPVIKQEVIHEDVKEDQNSDDDSDDDDEADAVFGHKQANRNKVSSTTSNNDKNPSMGELKVNVEGPIKINSTNFVHQRVPQSATHPSMN